VIEGEVVARVVAVTAAVVARALWEEQEENWEATMPMSCLQTLWRQQPTTTVVSAATLVVAEEGRTQCLMGGVLTEVRTSMEEAVVAVGGWRDE
jgi:hypothetical protein